MRKCLFIPKGNLLRNDVALLKVSEPLDLSPERHVKSIKLNTDSECPVNGQQCEVAGWGALDYGGKLWAIDS